MSPGSSTSCDLGSRQRASSSTPPRTEPSACAARSTARTSSSSSTCCCRELDGLRLLSELRQARADLPVLILSARSDLPTKLRGFDLGANDYLAKPFSFDELVARVRVHLRRGGDSTDGLTTPGRRASSSTWRAGRRRSAIATVDLSDREFRLLYHLVSPSGRGREPRTPALRGVGLQLRSGLERRRRVRAPATQEARLGRGDRDGEECRIPRRRGLTASRSPGACSRSSAWRR